MAKKKEEIEIVGAKIVGLRAMTSKEMDNQGWDEDNFSGNPVVLVLNNGTKLYASQDSEGNGPGAMFGTTKSGNDFGLG